MTSSNSVIPGTYGGPKASRSAEAAALQTPAISRPPPLRFFADPRSYFFRLASVAPKQNAVLPFRALH